MSEQCHINIVAEYINILIILNIICYLLNYLCKSESLRLLTTINYQI